LDHRVDIEERLKQLIKDKNQRRVFQGITIQGPKILATKWINSKCLEVCIEDDKEADTAGRHGESFSLTYRWDLKDKLILEPRKADKTYLVPACGGHTAPEKEVK
jgi:hypothetical protein